MKSKTSKKEVGNGSSLEKWESTFLTVEFRPVPVHVVFFVQDFEDLVLPERELVVGGGVEVVLGDRLHGRASDLDTGSFHFPGLP